MSTSDNTRPEPGRMQFRITRGWLIRITGSVIVLAITLSLLPLGEVVGGFQALQAEIFLAVLVLFLAGHVVAASKWWLVLGRSFSWPRALRAHFAGLAANLCLPGVAGGDAVRAALVMRKSDQKARIVAGSMTDRLVDMVALAMVSAAGLVMLAEQGSGLGVLIQIAVILALILIGLFVVMPRIMPRIVARFPKLPARKALLKLVEGFGWLASRPGPLLVSLAGALIVQAGFVLLTVWLATSIGVDAPIGAWFFAWPLAKILAALPISLGGIGVREASLAALMAPFTFAEPEIVAASLIWQAVLFAAGLLGAAAWALTSRTPMTETKPLSS